MSPTPTPLKNATARVNRRTELENNRFTKLNNHVFPENIGFGLGLRVSPVIQAAGVG